MDNPFVMIDRRLANIESLLLDIKHFPEPLPTSTRKIMSLTEFCDYTGLTKQTVYKLTSAQKVPHSKRGKRLYFDPEKVDAWLLENQVDTQKEIQEKAKDYLSKSQTRRRM